MRRHGVPFGAVLACVVLGGQLYTVGVKADASDDLLRSISAANQDLIGQSSEVARRIQENVRLKNELREIMNALDEQVPKLRDLLTGENGDLKDNDLKEQIDAIDKQIKKLKEQLKKLEVLQEKIATLMPEFEDALGQDQSAEESRLILTAVSQDRAKAAKLIQAIEDNKRAEIGNLLGQSARGTKVEVRETRNADGAMVVFRVGNLIHCLSTKAQCGGKSSSLTKAKTVTVPSAAEALKPLKDSLTTASKQAVASNRAIENFQSNLKKLGITADTSQDLAMELQSTMTQVVEAVTARSQMCQKLASMLEEVISNFRG